VAEDEEMLRGLADRLLRRHGFAVVLACDGADAVEVFLRERGRIDVVLLDLSMPRLSGREVLRRIRQLDPDLPVVLTSGYSDAAGEELQQLGIQGFVPKPYRDHDLVEAVRKAVRGAWKG
jgi:CheY-like chemotaxis protein